ncbi:manganese efflux pump MntP family protein [Enorma phocaeensis]|uniref:Putative manganese efflux pump MntP n=1 Tax=Enorma phocaeensis TaxID=1871019 RepID=A0A921IWX7_9ACTN|nr:manganese efflux pump MntP family protein [Enorma phocaeensis]HJG37552.1 manganese efflux pump MntP family protein [Enorma phocaeensis]
MNLSFTGADLIQSLLLGVALAMDAMAVTLSNSLCEPDMPASKKLAMPMAFAVFQMAMPILGFFGGTLITPLIEAYAGIVSLAILAFVGGKMIVEAIREMREPEECPTQGLTYGTIMLEAVATSIDAFVVGVSLAAAGANIVLYGAAIGVTTFACCCVVLLIGRRLGAHFGPRSEVAGGIVLILIGLKAFLG